LRRSPRSTRQHPLLVPRDTGRTVHQRGGINRDVLAEVVKTVLDTLDAERAWVEAEGEYERERAAEEAANEWLTSLPDEEREAVLAEDEEIWHAWMWAALKAD